MKSAIHRTIDEFFAEKIVQRKLFAAVRKIIASFGEVAVTATKSQIAFAGKRQFAWIWMPMPWDKKRPSACIVLSFALGRRVRNPQIVQVLQPYPGRWMHHVIIERERDLNKNVRAWLKRAYAFGANKTHRSASRVPVR